MAVLPAQAEPLERRPAPATRRLRTAALVVAPVALVLAVVPPIASGAHHYEFVETIQFDLLAFAAPALFVLGAPVRLVRGAFGERLRARIAQLAEGRRRHPARGRTFAFALVDVGTIVAWRVPGAMNALERAHWLLGLEAVTLLVAGVVFWPEVVQSAPLEPRLPHPWRGVVAAVSMWAVWVVAYVVGFSHVPWYVAYHHVAGGLGATADQELSTGALWLGAGLAFVPIVFTDLLSWLRKGEDPDAELRALVRKERWWGPPD